jgi:hypothetical protein
MRIANIVTGLALLAGVHAAPALAQERPLTIQHDRLPGMCLTLGGPGGASVNMPCSGAAHQKFILPSPEGGPIQQGDKCLVPRGTGYYPPVFLEPCDGSPEQTWTMNEERELRTAAGRCLSLMGAVSRSGTPIFAGECPNIGSAHQWKATYVDFTNVIEASLESSVRPGMCIGHDTQLELYPCSDSYGQIISFDEKALGQMRLKSSCLSGGYAFGGLSLGECHDLLSQKWVMLPDGAFANGRAECIEVVNENGRDVLRTTICGGKPEQHWIVRPKPEAAQ